MHSIKTTYSPELRLRVFAGPNGSGKSTVIEQVRQHKANGIPIEFGFYINADEIAVALRSNGLEFSLYDIKVSNEEFESIAIASGLVNQDFTQKEFVDSYYLKNNVLTLKNICVDERLAQVIADFLRKKLLAEKKRFSFETVFSHESKLEIMRQAVHAGYKVYLYFVSTKSPKINRYRVALRKLKGGHDVPPDKIESRYYRSLDLLFDACQLCYQAFFFDNSEDNKPFKMFAHFKKADTEKTWDNLPFEDIPEWFKKYYIKKIAK